MKSCHDSYQNLWFLIRKKFNQYHMINAAMNMNKIIIRDINLLSNVNEFFKEFVDMIMIFLIDLFSEYDQIMLTKIYQDLTMFMTSLKLLRQTMLSQDVINFVAQFVKIIIKILKNLLEICKSFLNNIEVKKSKTIYDNAKIISEVHQFMLKHIKNLDFILLNFELIDCIISDEKLQFCMSSIKIVRFVCDFHDCRSEDFKIIKILKWRFCHDVTSVQAFIEVCMYYQMWIKNFILIAASIFQLFKKKIKFMWERKQEKVMNKLKLILITASIMRSLNYSEETEEIVLIVNASFQEWKAMLQQRALNSKNQHFIWYESELWNEQETRYDAEKWECRDLMKTLKKIYYWLYNMKFVIEIDVNTLMMQLNQSASDLSKALMTWWLAWICLFDFDVHHVFNCKHSTLDELLRRLRESSNDEDDIHKKDINDFINAQLNFIHLCSVSIIVEEDMLILKDLYSEYFKKIAHYLIFLLHSFKMSTKEFWKFKHEALKFMIQDKHLFKKFNKIASVQRMMNLQEEHSNILQKLHDESDHCERKRTYQKMIDRYWWKKIWKNTCMYVKFCKECQL